MWKLKINGVVTTCTLVTATYYMYMLVAFTPLPYWLRQCGLWELIASSSICELVYKNSNTMYYVSKKKNYKDANAMLQQKCIEILSKV